MPIQFEASDSFNGNGNSGQNQHGSSGDIRVMQRVERRFRDSSSGIPSGEAAASPHRSENEGVHVILNDGREMLIYKVQIRDGLLYAVSL